MALEPASHQLAEQLYWINSVGELARMESEFDAKYIPKAAKMDDILAWSAIALD